MSSPYASRVTWCARESSVRTAADAWMSPARSRRLTAWTAAREKLTTSSSNSGSSPSFSTSLAASPETTSVLPDPGPATTICRTDGSISTAAH